MKKLLASSLMLSSLLFGAVNVVEAKVVDIYSPFNYQTVFTKNGEVKITFNVNATTLWNLPSMMILYINRIEQKRVKYGSTSYFTVNGVPDGKYTINIGLEGVDKRMMYLSDPVTFNVKRGEIVVAASE